MHDKDARLFFDTRVPRIRRHREGLKPMDTIVGDVHPIDIELTRADGTAVMPRAIAWMDVAIHRLPHPGYLEYALDAQLKGGERVSFGTTLAPKGKVLVRHLKRQHYLSKP
ncbi:hypothetical protein [Pseudomonas sp. NPDC086251]|uniref:hypothetical protein n=1 Tax=Pseudomonas sp. NPDC086251 TaxID=3364431 RepID=UPI0038381192